MYGQRGIVAMLEFCKDLREVAEPGTWLFNHANPMAMMTWAALDHGGVNTVGLCHGVQNGHRRILEAMEPGQTYRGHFNVKNGGIISNLPADCII